MENPASDDANLEGKILFDNNVLFENKIFAANVVAGSSYIVIVAFTVMLKAQPKEDSDYSDYNFLSTSGLLSLDEAYQAFMSLNQGGVGDGFAITEMEDGAEIEVRRFNSVDDLAQPVKYEAIRLARDILEKLKIKFGEQTLDGLMKDDDKAPLKKLLTGVDKVEITYLHHLENAAKIAPELLEDEDVIEAGNALGIFKHHGQKLQIKDLEAELVIAKASGNQELVQALTSAIQKLKVEVATAPDEYKAGSDKPIKELLDKIEIGLERLAHKMQEMTQAGLSTVQSSRDLGAQEMDQQSKSSIVDVGKSQLDIAKQNERLNQTVNMQKMNETIRNEKASSVAQAQQAQAQQTETQKSKEAQSARQERQEARQQRSERQQRRESRQQQQTQEQQSRQQRQEMRQQRLVEVQQRLEARQQRREARQHQAQLQENNMTIEENLRKMRREQRNVTQEQTKAQQQATAAAAITTQEAQNQTQQTKPQKSNNPNKINNATAANNKNDMMQSLLAGNMMGGGMQGLQSMQDMEVPDALKPNSPARMIKAITQQREAEIAQTKTNVEVSNAATPPIASSTDLPILIKQNNQLTR